MGLGVWKSMRFFGKNSMYFEKWCKKSSIVKINAFFWENSNVLTENRRLVLPIVLDSENRNALPCSLPSSLPWLVPLLASSCPLAFGTCLKIDNYLVKYFIILLLPLSPWLWPICLAPCPLPLSSCHFPLVSCLFPQDSRDLTSMSRFSAARGLPRVLDYDAHHVRVNN